MTDDDAAVSKDKDVRKCEICRCNSAKYRCPACEQRTCSLPCVKKHKAETGCNGQRDKTAFVSMKKFTDSHLLSDYRFLEDGGRKSQSCRRDFLKMRHDKPKALIKLIRHAESQGIELRTMPYPMSKRKNNSTFFLYKSKEILWHIEWVFPQADAKYFNKKQNQNMTLESILTKYLSRHESDPVVRHKLQQYVTAGVEGCRLLLMAEGRPADDVRYHELDGSKTILENLQGKCLVEYPSILVVLRSHCHNYTVLSKEEEDKMWQDRRKEKFSRQRNSPYQQKSSSQGDKPGLISSSDCQGDTKQELNNVVDCNENIAMATETALCNTDQ